MAEPILLDAHQMATFAARGFLRFDAAVPDAINAAFLDALGRISVDELEKMRSYYARIMASGAIPTTAPGTPLAQAYPADSPLTQLLALPAIRGAITSLVGARPIFDHHFLHITFPPAFYAAQERRQVAQHYHQDSTIDPRQGFDVQLLYFPHAVTAEMGGTRFLPGSHLRIVSEAAIARYQNLRGQEHVVCPAGTVIILHQGIWHGGGLNRADRLRYMFKIRIGASESQQGLWSRAEPPSQRPPQRPIFWTRGQEDPESIDAILTRPEPWHEDDTSRLEIINRVKFWRYLTGDEHFDADYWATRLEYA